MRKHLAVTAFVVAACSSAAPRAPAEEGPLAPGPTTTLGTPDASTANQDAPISTGTDGSSRDARDTCSRTPPNLVCGLIPQCGCGPAETCDLADDSGSVRCIASGTAKMGAACTSTAGCQQGLTCIYGTCHAFCSDVGIACAAPGTGICFQAASNGNPIPNATLCKVKCSLTDPLSCGGATAAGTGVCSPDSAGNTDCAAGGNLTEGATCATATDCGPGLACITMTVGSTKTTACRKWCRVGQADCVDGKSCSGFGTKLVVDGVEHGTCH